jgi:hypothetical protein
VPGTARLTCRKQAERVRGDFHTPTGARTIALFDALPAERCNARSGPAADTPSDRVHAGFWRKLRNAADVGNPHSKGGQLRVGRRSHGMVRL